MENKLIKFASKVSTPLSLASLVVIVLYLLYKGVLGLGIFSNLQEGNTYTLISSIVDKIFYLAVLALILGIAAYFYKLYLSQPKKQPESPGERFLNEKLNGRDIRPEIYAQKQIEAYHETWKSLDDLAQAGEKLWIRVNKTNLVAFLEQMQETKTLARKNKILFEQNHYNELGDLFEMFSVYMTGKKTVLELRNKKDDDLVFEKIKDRIEKNRKIREGYTKLLNEIGDAFTKQLSGR